MITTKPVSRNLCELSEIRRLYEASFPKRERDPFRGLLNHSSNLDFRACFDGDTLVGLYSILTVDDLSHIQFLAVEERLRDEGYGSLILAEIKERLKANRIIVDIEDPDEAARNHEQRLRRVHFYKGNGFVADDIRYSWHGQDYTILIWNGSLSQDEFASFWAHYESDNGGIEPSHNSADLSRSDSR